MYTVISPGNRRGFSPFSPFPILCKRLLICISSYHGTPMVDRHRGGLLIWILIPESTQSSLQWDRVLDSVLNVTGPAEGQRGLISGS